MESAAKSAIAHSGRFSLMIAMRSPFLIPQSWRVPASVTTESCSCFELISIHRPSTRCFATQVESRPTAAMTMSTMVNGPMLFLQSCDDHVSHGGGRSDQRIIMIAEDPRGHHLVQGAEEAVGHDFV